MPRSWRTISAIPSVPSPRASNCCSKTATPSIPDNCKFLSIIERTSRAALALVTDLLDLTLIETGRLELKVKSIDLGALIRKNVETNRLLAHRKNIRLETEIAPGLPAVNADPARVEQVLTNFISNAVKYSEPGDQRDRARVRGRRRSPGRS